MVAKVTPKGVPTKPEMRPGVKPSSRKPKDTSVIDVKDREVKYPDVYSEWYLRNNKSSIGPLNSAIFKKLLGWEDEDDYRERIKKENPTIDEESIIFPRDYFFTDQRGKKVILHNNSHNRPFTLDHCLTLAQDILNRFWADSGNKVYLEDPTITCNGEAIIIGQTGLTLSGQHRGIAVIFAEQIRQGYGIGKGQEAHWASIWGDEEIAIEGVVNYGISESAKVIRTFDNVKPRSFSDVLFTDPTLTEHMTKDDRVTYTKTVDYAIKFLWERTGKKKNSYAPRRTQSESMNFLLSHPSLKACSIVILQANGKRDKDGNKISKFMSLGDAAGICYLMACSEESGEDYWAADPRREGTGEDHCKATRLEQAVEFWKRFSMHIDFGELREAFGLMSSADTGLTPGGHRAEKLALLCHAWKAFLEGEEITGEICRVKKKFSKALEKNIMDEFPDFGGIDKGPNKPTEKKFRPLSETDIDSVLDEAQNDSILDGEGITDNVLEEEMEGSIIEEEQLDDDSNLDDLSGELSEEDRKILMEGDDEDKEAVEQAHSNHMKEVEEHNAKVLREELEKANPIPKITPANAFSGWNEEKSKPRKIKRKL